MFSNHKTYNFLKRFLLLLLITFAFFFSGCSNKPAYIKKWNFVKPNIWDKVEIDTSKLSADQKKVLSENGTPTYIFTFFEANAEGKKGKPVHEWVYEKQEKYFWFADGNLVDYVPVTLPKEKRIQIPGGTLPKE